MLNYLLDRALRAQGVVSLDSASYLTARRQAGDAAPGGVAGAPRRS